MLRLCLCRAQIAGNFRDVFVLRELAMLCLLVSVVLPKCFSQICGMCFPSAGDGGRAAALCVKLC